MQPTFTLAVVYHVQATSCTPLRSSDALGNVDVVLRTPQGQAYLQGSSLAGALKDYALKNLGESRTAAILGSTKGSGSLIVSDALFSPDARQEMRPRLRINGHSASADDRGKYDIAHMAAGSRFSFELTWLGTEQTEAETKDVEQLLSALNSGLILLGGQKSNGFGRVELAVTRQRYNLMDDTDRTSWLERKFNGEPICLSEIQPENIVTFILHGQADRILVKDSAPVQKEEGSVFVNLTENGQPVLPGSSIKGAVRGQVKRIAGYLGIGDERVNALFGRGAEENDQGIAGRVRFEDVSLSPYKQKISRIRINRFTGGVMNTGLFNEEPLCSKLTLKITAPADDSVGCGLLVYALRDLGSGMYNLGSGDAIGQGYLKGDRLEIEVLSGERAAICFDEDGGCSLEDADGLIQKWMQAVRREQA